MNKYDMSEFLEYCINSCSPSSDGNDDTCNIKNLKIGIKKFSIKHKKDIMDLFSFSENNGKYVSVYAVDLVSIIDEYEQYHNDMVKFIHRLLDCYVVLILLPSIHVKLFICFDTVSIDINFILLYLLYSLKYAVLTLTTSSYSIAA